MNTVKSWEQLVEFIHNCFTDEETEAGRLMIFPRPQKEHHNLKKKKKKKSLSQAWAEPLIHLWTENNIFSSAIVSFSVLSSTSRSLSIIGRQCIAGSWMSRSSLRKRFRLPKHFKRLSDIWKEYLIGNHRHFSIVHVAGLDYAPLNSNRSGLVQLAAKNPNQVLTWQLVLGRVLRYSFILGATLPKPVLANSSTSLFHPYVSVWKPSSSWQYLPLVWVRLRKNDC